MCHFILISKNFNSKIGLGTNKPVTQIRQALQRIQLNFKKILSYRPARPSINDVTHPGPLLGRESCQIPKSRVKSKVKIKN